MIGVSEVGSKVREITLLALLKEGGALNGIPNAELDTINDIAVVWNYEPFYSFHDGEILVTQIYNHETGEIYWEDHEGDWTDKDELIVNSLLMFGELESTIG